MTRNRGDSVEAAVALAIGVMPPLPHRHYEHFNKKKMVVAVVLGILILLAVVWLAAGSA